MSAEPDLLTAGLLARARAGDQRAFDALFERVAERALAYIRARLGPRLRGKVEAVDVLQEAYVTAFGKLDDFAYRGPGSFAAWVCRIAGHVVADAADHFGALKRRSPDGTRNVTALIDRARSRTGPATAAERAEQLERLEAALDELADDERQALLLRYFHERTLDEVAEELGLHVSAVRRLIGRAMSRVGRALGGI